MNVNQHNPGLYTVLLRNHPVYAVPHDTYDDNYELFYMHRGELVSVSHVSIDDDGCWHRVVSPRGICYMRAPGIDDYLDAL